MEGRANKRNSGLSRASAEHSRIPMSRRDFICSASATAASPTLYADNPRTVVLTFDDGLRSHLEFVAPLLKKMGFGATFFVTHRWMNDQQEYLDWNEIADISRMGFEIGNHSWTHSDFSVPRNGARLASELALVEGELRKQNIGRAVSFAYSDDSFGPEAISPLLSRGYKFARRGIEPEFSSGNFGFGRTFDPENCHPLLIPTTGSSNPSWTLDHFRRVVEQAEDSTIVVLRFHGIPDSKHPSRSTSKRQFQDYMNYLKERSFQVIALRDMTRFGPADHVPARPLLGTRYPAPRSGRLLLPGEMQSTRADLAFWLENMISFHGYSWDEAAVVTGIGPQQLQKLAADSKINTGPPRTEEVRPIRILPYPGGRHPRIGHREGAIDPVRGTKASIFLPWKQAGYIVIDLPETIETLSDGRVLFLAHTSCPTSRTPCDATVWTDRNIWLENVDWVRNERGGLERRQILPNTITFGASIRPGVGDVEMEFYLKNESATTLIKPRAAICVMLGSAPGFNQQTNANKIFRCPAAAVGSSHGDRWILLCWQRCFQADGNREVPCLHADPMLPDCPPGKTVRVLGRLWFYEGANVEDELRRAPEALAARL
jgi:peptidoglycan/xylan/chitin deacetylase (PgdA/CDA1 family)